MSHLEGGILILDYGSQYTLLIARRIRELGVYSEVWPCNDPRVAALTPTSCKGVVLSGGPASVAIVGAPALQDTVLTLGVAAVIAPCMSASVPTTTRADLGRVLRDAAVGARDGRACLTRSHARVWAHAHHGDARDGAV